MVAAFPKISGLEEKTKHNSVQDFDKLTECSPPRLIILTLLTVVSGEASLTHTQTGHSITTKRAVPTLALTRAALAPGTRLTSCGGQQTLETLEINITRLSSLVLSRSYIGKKLTRTLLTL